MVVEALDVLKILTVAVALVFFYGRLEGRYFKRKGVQSLSAYIPFIGHMMGILRQKETFRDFILRISTFHPDERYIGVHQFLEKRIILTDPELIKQITVRDFQYFQDHSIVTDEAVDPLLANNLFVLTGQKWRDMRAALSPAFTSTKIRESFDSISECGKQMVQNFIDEMKKTENKAQDITEVELKDLFGRYTSDIIACVVFGLKANAVQDREDEFFMMSKKLGTLSGMQFFKFFIMQNMPRVVKLLGIAFFPKSVDKFFRHLVMDTERRRLAQNLVTSDMIGLLIKSRRGGVMQSDREEERIDLVEEEASEENCRRQRVKQDWTDDEIVAQTILTIIAGLETTSTVLCFLFHELAVQPHIQKKLQQEVMEVASRRGGDVSYDQLNQMKYMDMVVSEVLRCYPPIVHTDRKCVKPYCLPPPNTNSQREYQVKVGDCFWIPIFGLHHNPKYFQNPGVFDPERFSDQNKRNIVPSTYIPFGIGPRYCTGNRFALVMIKTAVFHLLLNFNLVTTSKTQNPIVLKKNSFNAQAENGFWIGLKSQCENR